MSATEVRQQQRQIIQQGLERAQQVDTPQEAWSKLTVSPSLMVYEARFALQQLREIPEQNEQMPAEVILDLIEPLARAIGWAEGLAFAFDRVGGPLVGATSTDGNTKSQR